MSGRILRGDLRRWRGSGRGLVSPFRLTVVLVLCSCVLPEGRSVASDPVVNCNQVEKEDRCDCNRRVLRALHDIKIATDDPTQSRNTTPRNIQDAVQEEYRHRLRTFIAPECRNGASPRKLPEFNERSAASSAPGALSLQPLFTRDLCLSKCEYPDAHATDLLPGRWEGWQTLTDGKTTPLFFHIGKRVDRGGYVKACSNNGMVVGTVRKGFLELPGPRAGGLSYVLRLWEGGPHFRDLEGVALLEVRPGEEFPAGLVWLTRAQKFAWSLMPTAYFCEDRELEDTRE